MTVRPDRAECITPPDEWVVLRYGAIRIDADDLPVVGKKILCLFALEEALALRDEQRSIVAKNDSRSVMKIAPHLGILLIDDADFGQPAIAQLPLCHRRSRGVLRPGLRVRQINQMVGRELRIELHVQKSALIFRVHGGHTGNGR